MKGKKLLDDILSAAAVLAVMAVPVFAENRADRESNSDANVVVYGAGESGTDVHTQTLYEALNAVYMSSPTDAVTVECRAGADVGTISKAGIKYISSADGDVGEAKGVEDSISGNAFYGDINKIPNVKSGKYYAKAYVESGGGTVWSQLIDCAVNWAQKFTAYTGGEN